MTAVYLSMELSKVERKVHCSRLGSLLSALEYLVIVWVTKTDSKMDSLWLAMPLANVLNIQDS